MHQHHNFDNIIHKFYNSNIDIDESSRIIGNVIDKFENKTFKEYASRIADISRPEDIPTLLDLMEEWKSIEAKQFRDLAYSRIEVIKQLEKIIGKTIPKVEQISWEDSYNENGETKSFSVYRLGYEVKNNHVSGLGLNYSYKNPKKKEDM